MRYLFLFESKESIEIVFRNPNEENPRNRLGGWGGGRGDRKSSLSFFKLLIFFKKNLFVRNMYIIKKGNKRIEILVEIGIN